MRFFLFVTALLGLSLFGSAEERPNILLITCDNLGYGDLQSYRPESPIQTPNLDRLASEGARLTQFYTASPTCTVSRACLMTGRIPERHGLKNQLGGIEGNYGVGLNQKEILIPGFCEERRSRTQQVASGNGTSALPKDHAPRSEASTSFLGMLQATLITITIATMEGATSFKESNRSFVMESMLRIFSRTRRLILFSEKAWRQLRGLFI